MSTATDWVVLHGSCHCGELQIDFATGLNPGEVIPRACDCTFCQKHGAAYVSDPGGGLSVFSSPGAVLKYRQGASAADFLICAHCGVLVGVTYQHDSRLYGAVNIGCLDRPSSFGVPASSSPQLLSQEEKVSRWLQLWIPDVRMLISAT